MSESSRRIFAGLQGGMLREWGGDTLNIQENGSSVCC